jgi:hypothetical protein
MSSSTLAVGAVGAVLGVSSLVALRKLAKLADNWAIQWLSEFADKLIESITAKFGESLQSYEQQLSSIATTSQVCATRANITEWRSCLESISSWHGVSLQSAYSIWRSGSAKVPSCPANQSLEFEGSQPLTVTDRVWSEVSLESPQPVPRFQQCPEVDKLEMYIYSMQANMAAVGAASWQVKKWSADKLVSLEAVSPWIHAVEQHLREELLVAAEEQRQFMSPARSQRVAEFCEGKSKELEEWAVAEPSIAQTWESMW